MNEMRYQTKKSFPSDFLWGASTSAYQVEGAYLEDGKSPSIIDMYEHPKDTADFKIASDHYHRYKEDIKLFAEMGMKAYRFSIAWTRIIPDGTGSINEPGVAYYRDMIAECRKYGIEPIVTMYHFDLPYCLEEKGGWNNRDTIDAFVNYAETLFELYGKEVRYWLTINEQNTMILHPGAIGLPKGGKLPTKKELYQQNHHMMLAQARVMKLFHTMVPDGKIGPALNLTAMYPATCKPEDAIAASRNDGSDVAARAGDQQIMLGEEGIYRPEENPYVEKTKYGWVIDPVGFRYTLRKVYERYHLPILVTENGIGAPDILEDGKIHDDYRIDFLEKHLEQMKLAITDGVEMLGYCPWSAIDVVSTHQGYQKRSGFIYVDRDEFDLKEMKRYPKDSYYWYQKVIAENGESL